MESDKNYLQTIKLEISRNFKLVPYERLTFHSVLGILKSETALSILLKELDKGADVRQSAIKTLVHCDRPQVLNELLKLLPGGITDEEKITILTLARRHPTGDCISAVIEYINYAKSIPEESANLAIAFDSLKIASTTNDQIAEFLADIIIENNSLHVTCLAIESLISLEAIPLFEQILKNTEDSTSRSVYLALHTITADLSDKYENAKTEEDKLYTFSPETENKMILNIRVLLGKMTTAFDAYSGETKVAFISAMISCNHREYLIYIMKSLTSRDNDLVMMTLYTIYANIARLRDPDKLFRSLISVSTESRKINEFIVEIFTRYFTTPNNTRQFHILQDKLYSYIVVTLETYFETYRKDFMITDVIEKGYPENFQKIRAFILEQCSPELKREIVSFLSQDDPALANHIITDMAKTITYVRETEKEILSLLIEVLLDKDVKSRENSASRIDDINFDKLYLRNRIIRLCMIISNLSIDSAASPLVNIYNYLKKYPDIDILNATVQTLSLLNYSYMLGELEVMLNSGTDTDKARALELIALYTEQRSLNILLELVKNRLADDSSIVETAVTILLDRDISGNITASQLFKALIESNQNPKIRNLAILGIGRCGFAADIDYLNELFSRITMDSPKDIIVRAIGDIIAHDDTINARAVMRFLQEYLKDPGIKVRIYSCLLLAHLGNRDAMRSIRDMLIIKNKGIQRDILSILGKFNSLEFSYFLISLLREEYGISMDLIPVIKTLNETDMKDIDAFVVNVFRKYEAPDIESVGYKQTETKMIMVPGLKKEEKTILMINVSTSPLQSPPTMALLIERNLLLKNLIISVIQDNSGAITRMSNDVIMAMYTDTIRATKTAELILEKLNRFNQSQPVHNSIHATIQLLSGMTKTIGDELIDSPQPITAELNALSLINRIILDHKTAGILKTSYNIKKIPSHILSRIRLTSEYYELLSPINFTRLAESMVKQVTEEEGKKEQMQQQLAEEMKKMKRTTRSTSAAAIARELDNIGEKLQGQLEEIDRYVQKRSTDRELIKNVRKMLNNAQDLYRVEVTRIILD